VFDGKPELDHLRKVLHLQVAVTWCWLLM